MRWRLCLVLVCLFVVSIGLAAGADTGAVPPPVQDSGTHQLLVMLHMPAPHFRPDSAYSGRYTDDAGHSARRRIAADIAREHHLKLLSDWPMPTLGVDCYVMEADAPLDPLIDQLAHDARIEWVQKMSNYRTLDSHDPLYSLQPAAISWHLEEVHQVTTGRAIRIAIVDSGIDEKHPDLLGQIKLRENFVDGNPYIAEKHGTAVAGIISAIAGNGKGIEGIAPNAHLLALRACWEVSSASTQCNSFTLGKALNFALMNKAQVINMSLTGPPDKLLQMLLAAALEKGIVVVGAVDPQQLDGGFPASVPGVLAMRDTLTEVLGAGVAQSFIAPGRDIPTTQPGGQWGLVNGTSFACAHGTGLVALMLEIQPGLNAEKLKHDLISISAETHASGNNKTDNTIDVCNTIGKLKGSCVCSCPAGYAAKAHR